MTPASPLNLAANAALPGVPLPACAAPPAGGPAADFSGLLALLLPQAGAATAAGDEAQMSAPESEKKKEEDAQENVSGVAAPAFFVPIAPVMADATDPEARPALTLVATEAAPLAETAAPVPTVEARTASGVRQPLVFALRLTPQQEGPLDQPATVASAGERQRAQGAAREIAVPRLAPAQAAEPVQAGPEGPERRIAAFTDQSTPSAPATLIQPALEPRAATSGPVRPAAPAEPVALEPLRDASQPVHELSLSVPNRGADSAGHVELRVVERAGHVHVAVRSADPQLAHALDQQLGDLVHRLEHSGYRADFWRADAVAERPAPAAASTSGAQPGSDRDSGSGGHSGFTRQDGRQHQQPQRQPRPQWLEALETKPDLRSMLHGYLGS